MPLQELEKFIAREKHLPNVPNASEIKQYGLNLSEFQMKLLEKIEELTLYTVQQAKTIDRKEQEIRDLTSSLHTALELKDTEVATLSARLSALERMIEGLTKQGARK